jgi:hypothetical protein
VRTHVARLFNSVLNLRVGIKYSLRLVFNFFKLILNNEYLFAISIFKNHVLILLK